MASTSGASSKQVQRVTNPPIVKPVVTRASGNSILVNRRQEKNPVLELLRNVAWEYAAITPDFQLGATTCALFLSLRYYRLHPEYLHRRVSDLGSSYTLRLLLFMVDAKDPENEIKELTKICLINNITIMAVWNLEEAAHYLMTYKAYEHKSPDMIKERIDKDYISVLRSALTSVKGVNKTDVTTMRTNFGDFATMSRATYDELNLLPGFGKVKARRVRDAFDKPFRNGSRGVIKPQDKGKGKEKAASSGTPSEYGEGFPDFPTTDDEPRPANRAPPGSPDWDIDLDLNSDWEELELPAPSTEPDVHPTKERVPNPFASERE